MTKLASNAAVKSHFITFEVIDKTKSHLTMKAIFFLKKLLQMYWKEIITQIFKFLTLK